MTNTFWFVDADSTNDEYFDIVLLVKGEINDPEKLLDDIHKIIFGDNYFNKYISNNNEMEVKKLNITKLKTQFTDENSNIITPCPNLVNMKIISLENIDLSKFNLDKDIQDKIEELSKVKNEGLIYGGFEKAEIICLPLNYDNKIYSDLKSIIHLTIDPIVFLFFSGIIDEKLVEFITFYFWIYTTVDKIYLPICDELDDKIAANLKKFNINVKKISLSKLKDKKSKYLDEMEFIYIIKRENKRNSYTIGINPYKYPKIFYYWVIDSSPLYKYSKHLKKRFEVGPWIDAVKVGKIPKEYSKSLPRDNKSIPNLEPYSITYSTRNKYSKVIDWIDGLIQSKFDLIELMGNSEYMIESARNVDQVDDLPETDRYIIKPGDIFDKGDLHIVNSKERAKSFLSSKKGWIAQPLLEPARRFLNKHGPITFKIYFIAFVPIGRDIPFMVYLKRGVYKFEKSRTGDTVRGPPGHAPMMSEGLFENYEEYIWPAIKEYHDKQRKYFIEKKNKVDHPSITPLSLDIIPSNYSGTEFKIIEINRQPSVDEHREKDWCKSAFDFREEFMDGYYKVIKYLAMEDKNAILDIGDRWISF